MRVYELAQALKISNSTVLHQAAALTIEASSPLSRLDEDDQAALRKALARTTDADGSDTLLASRRQKTEQARERRDRHVMEEIRSLNENAARARKLETEIRGTPAPESTETAAAVAVVSVAATVAATVAEKPTEKTEIKIGTGSGTEQPVQVIPAEPQPTAETTEDATGQEARNAAVAEPGGEEEEAFEEAETFLPSKKVQKTAPRVRGRGRLPDDDVEREPATRKITPPSTARTKPTAHATPERHSTSVPVGRKTTGENGSLGTTGARVLQVRGAVLVKELAELMGMRPNQIIAELMQMNVLASINQRVELDLANRIAELHGYKLELERSRRSAERRPSLRREDADDDIPDDVQDDMKLRPPVVTFLGHVDHGKTSLLDRICNTRVATGEDGGITQHIGAHTVDVSGRKITFLDTPGHAAFSSMRARGASLTDIAVIVVAADDGIMPQTREAIQHARQAGVTLMMAINKMDLPGANADRVRQQLQGEGLTPEEWGGDLVCCEVSAQSGDGIEHLLEMILLQADVLELSANPNRRASGFVIEARLEQGRGPTATLLVNGGTLSVGDVVLCGAFWGRIRALVDDQGRLVKNVGPGIAVQCLGLSGVPEAGAAFRVMKNEKRARDLSAAQALSQKQEDLSATKAASLDDLMSQIDRNEKPELSLILKGDTQGSLEAVEQSLREIRSQKVALNIVHSSIGNISATDVQRAAAGKALIVGFHVSAETGVQALARHHSVRIRSFRIIYELIDQMKKELLDLLDPEFAEQALGQAQIRQVFTLHRRGTVAGCLVTKGVIQAKAQVRVMHGSEERFVGRIASLRHFQDEVAEVREAQECGILLKGFEAFEEGDIIHCFTFEERERML